MPSGTVVASLDVLVRILESPDWRKKAGRVKTLKQLRQLIIDFCEVNGRVVRANEETFYT